MSRFTEWTLAQACLWIASKDEAQVAALRPNHSFAELAFTAELDRHDHLDNIYQPDWIVAAQEELLGAARTGIARGGIEITGQPSNRGPRSVVPAVQCTRIYRGREFPGTYQTLLSETEAECLGQPGGVYWTELRVQADDVRRVWPAAVDPDELAEESTAAALPAHAHVEPAAIEPAEAPALTEPEAAPMSASDIAEAWAAPIIRNIVANGLQLKRRQFVEMIRNQPFGQDWETTAIERVWAAVRPLEWGKPSRIRDDKAVADWRRYVDGATSEIK